jgi:hypothetical protein
MSLIVCIIYMILGLNSYKSGNSYLVGGPYFHSTMDKEKFYFMFWGDILVPCIRFFLLMFFRKEVEDFILKLKPLIFIKQKSFTMLRK